MHRGHSPWRCHWWKHLHIILQQTMCAAGDLLRYICCFVLKKKRLDEKKNSKRNRKPLASGDFLLCFVLHHYIMSSDQPIGRYVGHWWDREMGGNHVKRAAFSEAAAGEWPRSSRVLPSGGRRGAKSSAGERHPWTVTPSEREVRRWAVYN